MAGGTKKHRTYRGKAIKPTIGITMGDPAGVGPEIVLKAIASPNIQKICIPVIFGDKAVLDFISARCRLKSARCEVINLSALEPEKLRSGKPNNTCGKAAMKYIEQAVNTALTGSIDAVVTAPINKEGINMAGYDFNGHTEYLAHLTNTRDYVMMLAGKSLKVALVTIHTAIKDIPIILKAKDILKTIKITNASLKQFFSIKKPRIGVCALNPHAGEGGLFGTEEKGIIMPALKKARVLGINVSPPLPSDSIFYRAVQRNEFDAVVCMYHDQGLIPLKLLHFEDGVNITLGLPVIRTSVDHGTGYDIAWKGIAKPDSMLHAIETAVKMVKAKNHVFS